MLKRILNSRRATSKIKKSVFALILMSLALTIIASFRLTAAVAEDWPQFRGPNGSGVSSTTGLPQEFGPNKNVVWKTELPPGHSSPVLTRDRIFVTAHTKKTAQAGGKETYKLLVICLDRQTGKLLWQREVPRLRAGRLQLVNGPASPSPVTDGSNVTSSFKSSAWSRMTLPAKSVGGCRSVPSTCSTVSAPRQSSSMTK